MAIKQGSLRQDLDNIYQILISDEELLRLLWYMPKRISEKDPLDNTLPNITYDPSDEIFANLSATKQKEIIDTYWNIVDERVLLVEKINDLETKPLCRLYLTLGRRRQDYENNLLSKQEIVISIFVHEDYEWDMRMAWIIDRINSLIALEELAGIGKLNYVSGRPYQAPLQYSQYVNVYEYVTGKK